MLDGLKFPIKSVIFCTDEVSMKLIREMTEIIGDEFEWKGILY